MNKISLLLGITLFALSCDRNVKYSENAITLSNTEFVKNAEIQRYIKGIDFFVIDTTKLFISAISKMIVDKDCYILKIGKVHNEIVVVKKDGNIIGRIDNRGSGPGEYKDLTDFTYNFQKKEIIIFDILSKSIFTYSLNGNFLFQKRLNIQATNLITDDKCLYFYTKKLPSDIGDGWEIVVFDENYNLSNSFFEYTEQPYRMRSSSTSVFTRNSKAEIFFSNEFRDTTYLINKANCLPFLIYNIPDELPKRFTTDLNLYNENFRRYSNHRGYFATTDNWASFNLQEKGRSYDYYLSLKTGKIFKALFTQISPNIYLKTPLANSSDRFYYVLPTEWIEGHFSEFCTILRTFGKNELLDYYNKDIINYNPVIISIEFLDI